MKKKIIYSLIFASLLIPNIAFAARTDNLWSDIGGYIKTNLAGGYNILINGVNKYLNFNTISGSAGYGFRDNTGIIEVKNSGETWHPVVSATSPYGLHYQVLHTNASGIPEWTYDLGSATTRLGTIYSDYIRTKWLEVSQNVIDNSFKIGSSTNPVSTNLLFANTSGDASIIFDTDATFKISTSTQITGSLTANNLWYLNGNTLGSKKTLGSIDNQDFGIITNNTERLTVLKGGNVGIGTNNPGGKLTIDVGSGSGYQTNGLLISESGNYVASIGDGGASGAQFGYLGLYSTGNVERVRLYAYGNNWIAPTNGNLGIGTTSPSNGKLEINAGNGITGIRINGGTTADTDLMRLVGNAPTQRLILERADSGVVTFLEAGTTVGLFGTESNHDFRIRTNYQDRVTINTSGNVGIGTTAPNEQLEITKNFRLPATSGTTPYGIIYKNGNRFIHDFNYGLNGNGITTTGRNTFVGLNAGNLTMGSTATNADQASYNTGIGYGSLFSNTTGNNNTANGYQSLRSNTTGYYNTANGSYSLYSNTTGYRNTANGSYSLYSNTTGYRNTANGSYSLYSNTTGSNNSAIGYMSGRYIANGTTGRSTGNNGLYLGYNSMASADETENEIVIGTNAIGKGSNTIKLGNSSILATYTDGEIYKGTEQSKVQGVVFTQIADKTIGNTTTETTMFSTGVGSLTIPANSLVVGRTYRIKLKGYASGTNGDTSTIKVKLGTTELVSSTGTWQTLTDIGFTLEFDFTCRTTGATGTVAGNGFSFVSGGQGFSTVTMRALLAGTDTLNTTVDQAIDLTYKWSDAKAGNTITITNASVEVLN